MTAKVVETSQALSPPDWPFPSNCYFRDIFGSVRVLNEIFCLKWHGCLIHYCGQESIDVCQYRHRDLHDVLTKPTVMHRKILAVMFSNSHPILRFSLVLPLNSIPNVFHIEHRSDRLLLKVIICVL